MSSHLNAAFFLLVCNLHDRRACAVCWDACNFDWRMHGAADRNQMPSTPVARNMIHKVRTVLANYLCFEEGWHVFDLISPIILRFNISDKKMSWDTKCWHENFVHSVDLKISLCNLMWSFYITLIKKRKI